MSQRSRYENRAKLISKGVRKEDTLPPAKSRDEAWQEVKTKEQVEHFYQLYYPHLPDILCKALADMFHRATQGQIELPDQFLTKPVVKSWDFEKEINDLKNVGLVNNQIKRFEELAVAVVDSPPSSGPLAKVD